MKLLCPTDFSNASVNACRWAAKFLDQMGGGQLELLHCINVVSRSVIFLKMDDVFMEQGKNDLKDLQKKLQSLAPSVQITSTIVKSDPKQFVPSYVKGKIYDLIVIGTKGLSSLKEMTIGSVTAFLMDRVDIPLLAVPEKSAFRAVQKIILGLDDKINDSTIFTTVVHLVNQTGAKLELVHTTKEEDLPLNYQPQFVPELGDIEFTATILSSQGSITKTLTHYSLDQQADILVLAHRKRGWFERIFINSLSREELFVIATPLLILPDA